MKYSYSKTLGLLFLILSSSAYFVPTYCMEAVVLEKPADDRIALDDDCAICVDKLLDDTPLAYLDCSEDKLHIYHLGCLKQLIIKVPQKDGKFSCPLCRQPVTLFDTRHILGDSDKEELGALLALEGVALSSRSFVAVAFEKVLDRCGHELKDLARIKDECRAEELDFEEVKQWVDSEHGSPWPSEQVLQNRLFFLDQQQLASEIERLRAGIDKACSLREYLVDILKNDLQKESEQIMSAMDQTHELSQSSLCQDDWAMEKNLVHKAVGYWEVSQSSTDFINKRLTPLFLRAVDEHHDLRERCTVKKEKAYYYARAYCRLYSELFEMFMKGDREKVVALSGMPIFEQLINRPNERGSTLLHLATQSSSVDIVLFLLEKGADLSVRDNEGKTPLECACNDQVKKLLLEYPETDNGSMLTKLINAVIY